MPMVPPLAAIAAANVAIQGPSNLERLREAAQNYGADCAKLIAIAQKQINELTIYLDEEEPLVEATYSKAPSKSVLSYLLLRYRDELMDALSNALNVDNDNTCWRALAIPELINAISLNPDQNKAPFRIKPFVQHFPRLAGIIQCIINLNVDLADNNGRTALMWAAGRAADSSLSIGFEVAEKLLKAGASL